MVKIKRKVVQHGPSTLIVSLPSEWAKKHKIKKGDEIEVNIKGENIILGAKPLVDEEHQIEVDFSGLDRSSIMFSLRSLYRIGYNEIKINFKNATTKHFRTNKGERVISVIHQEVARLTGVDIIEERDDFCIIKQITQDSDKNFDIIFRKIFFQLEGAFSDLVKSIKKKDPVLLGNIEEKHDIITKFVSYCLRLLNLGKLEKEKYSLQIYHTLKNIDLIIDILKYFSRYIIENNVKFDSKEIEVIEKILYSHEIYNKLFFSYKKEYLVNFHEIRDSIKKLESKIKINKKRHISYLLSLLEIERDLVETRLSMM